MVAAGKQRSHPRRVSFIDGTNFEAGKNVSASLLYPLYNMKSQCAQQGVAQTESHINRGMAHCQPTEPRATCRRLAVCGHDMLTAALDHESAAALPILGDNLVTKLDSA